MDLKEMNKDERSLLIYLETCMVDYRGKIDHRRLNNSDVNLLESWNNSGFIDYGRVEMADIEKSNYKHYTHWIILSNDAWKLAHQERINRSLRMNPYGDKFDVCSHCGEKYNSDNEGHYDEETELCFCGAPCEMNYDREIGLPDNYKRC